jgi:uncharacterized protein (DUF305 family)
MNNNQLTYGLVGLLIGGILVWFLMVGTGVARMPGMMGMPFFSQNRTANFSMMDAHFIEQMIPHHEDAITMARLALEKAQHPEIKQLAQAIIDSQSAEIDQMKQWYKDWYGKAVPEGTQVMGQHGMMANSGMHMGMMGNETDITRLEQAADFDRAFIEHMIPHHQMAVMMANMLKTGTERSEMRQLADNIIEAQTLEINQMRQWYDAWF